MQPTPMTPVVALKTFFGMKPGQSLTDFTAEVKALSPAERDELAGAACAALGTSLIVKA